MEEKIFGIDIGGTKCVVTYGIKKQDELTIVDEIIFATIEVDQTIQKIITAITKLLEKYQLKSADIQAIGISCGGPLNSDEGIILSPPNLIGWDEIPIVNMIESHFNIKTGLQNDANACALAEWKFGSGKGSRNMVFLTFGTGLGAGLILNNQLYTGTNDNAGEVGHIRLANFGPVGYGKSGSFEGFCSGGGLVQIAKTFIMEKYQMGSTISWCSFSEMDQITAKQIAEEAHRGDPLAIQIFETSARELGKGLSILIDILNPEVIVIGGIYTRCRSLMEPIVNQVINQESLINSARVCKVLPALLGEQIGAYSALSVAANLN